MAPKRDFHHCLPVSDSTMQWGIYLSGAGRTLNPVSDDYPFEKEPVMYDIDWRRGRTLPEFAAILITEGKGVFESEQTCSVDVDPGTLIFLFPGVWHRYKSAKPRGWAERWIVFNGDVSYRLMNQELITPQSAVLPVKGVPKLISAFDRLLDRVAANPLQDPVLLSMHTLGLLAAVIESAVGRPRPTPQTKGEECEDSLVSRVIDDIWTKSHQPVSIPRLTEAAGVSRRKLERRFREARGHSILQEITICRCSRAKRFLLETDLPIKSITHLSGFTSENRLRAAFEELVGMPPTAYRKKHGKFQG